MASITSIGTGSGIDLEGLVKNIVDAERAPTENRLNLKEATAEARISAFGSLKGALSEFQSALGALNSASDFEIRAASSSDPEYFYASTDGSTLPASYNIKVFDEAFAHKVASGEFTSTTATVGEGILSISTGSTSFDVTISDSNNTVTGIRDAINNASNNTGVSANVLSVENEDGEIVQRLVLSSTQTGEDFQLGISVDEGTGSDADNTDDTGLSQLFYEQGNADSKLEEIQAAQNARVTIDGLVATSSSNTFDDVIEGLSFTVVKAQEDPENDAAIALDVSNNNAGIEVKIRNFVDSYNNLFEVINQLTIYEEETDTVGLLNGDASVRNLANQLRRILADSVSGMDGEFNRLGQLGVLTQRDGKLEVRSGVLSDSVEANLEQVAELFTSESGITTKFEALINEYTRSNGVIDQRNDGLETELDEVTEDRLKLNRRLTQIEENFRRQFANLDILVTQLNSTSNFLAEQLDATAKIINRKSE